MRLSGVIGVSTGLAARDERVQAPRYSIASHGVASISCSHGQSLPLTEDAGTVRKPFATGHQVCQQVSNV